MLFKPSVNVYHRCGTCGTIFGSLRELGAHLAAGHGGDRVADDEEGEYQTPLRGEGMQQYALPAQFHSYAAIQ